MSRVIMTVMIILIMIVIDMIKWKMTGKPPCHVKRRELEIWTVTMCAQTGLELFSFGRYWKSEYESFSIFS